jgi:hypothetical protein
MAPVLSPAFWHNDMLLHIPCLIKGIGNNFVSPQTGANRAQFAVIMQRYYTDFVERIID